MTEPLTSNSSAAIPNATGAPNGTIAATAVNSPNKVGCGTPVTRYTIPSRNPSPSPTSTSPSTVPCTEAIICRPIRSPAGPNARCAGAQQLGVQPIALLEQEEQRQQREAEQHQPVRRLAAEFAAVGDELRLARAFHQVGGLARAGQVVLPPMRGLRAAHRQVAQPFRRRDALGARLLEGFQHAVHLLAGLVGDQHERDDEQQADGRR